MVCCCPGFFSVVFRIRDRRGLVKNKRAGQMKKVRRHKHVPRRISLIRVIEMKSGKIKWKQLLVCVAAPLLVGGLAGLLSRGGMEDYQSMYKPLLAPPGWVFPAAWTLLYILMGLASYFVYTSAASPERIRRAMGAYVLQLAANFIWPLIFFVLGLYLLAFIWLILLFALALVCALRFDYIDARAGKLMAPYLAWLFFAAYLNLGVYLLN